MLNAMEVIKMVEVLSFKAMSDKQLMTWLKKNNSDEPGMAPVFANQIKFAIKDLKRRGLTLIDVKNL